MKKYLWDSRFTLFTLTGEDSRKFLHGQTTADVINAKEGANFYGCWLTPVGKLRALLEIRVFNEVVYFLLLAGEKEEVINGLEKVIFISDKVKINFSSEIRRVQVVSFDKPWTESNSIWLQLDSNLDKEFDNYSVLDKDGIMEWKINQGFPNSLYELDGQINPLEFGLSDLIDFDKGCYLGQETIAKVKNLGQTKCKIKLFISDILIKPGDKLTNKVKNEKRFENVGTVTSIIRKNDIFIGLALIRSNFLDLESIELACNSAMIKLYNTIGFKNI